MRRSIVSLLLAALLCSGFAACKKKPVSNLAARKAAFQEKQRKAAIKAYSDLAAKYPDSEFAPRAKQKLQQLQQASPSKK